MHKISITYFFCFVTPFVSGSKTRCLCSSLAVFRFTATKLRSFCEQLVGLQAKLLAWFSIRVAPKGLLRASTQGIRPRPRNFYGTAKKFCAKSYNVIIMFRLLGLKPCIGYHIREENVNLRGMSYQREGEQRRYRTLIQAFAAKVYADAFVVLYYIIKGGGMTGGVEIAQAA
jgi:hypothetical protein